MPRGLKTNCAIFLRIPSISASPENREDMQRAADWVADQFRRLRFATEIIPTAGHPMVYAESPEGRRRPDGPGLRSL